MKTCLTIAGSDPCGGAGIQADLKTFAANGVYGMSVVTALTAQNTLGVDDIMDVSADFIIKQIDSVFADIVPDAVKTGMLGGPESIEKISEFLKSHKAKKIVIDPVMVSTSGSKLISDESKSAMRKYLLPVADIITPNIPEAEELAETDITSEDDLIEVGNALREEFGCAVLIKGGHAMTDLEFSTDILFAGSKEPVYFRSKRVDNENTHGTGCTLSSAIAAGIAKGMNIKSAVHRAKIYVTGAIKDGLNIGKGRGPLNHFYKNGG